ncbi:MAG: hypothetical protein KIT34_18295 [Cyanobacteria bacterium TGS_CYA1]|nr:hypothetical protein [Cyanobacteria bacterium TGS_CYA1]
MPLSTKLIKSGLLAVVLALGLNAPNAFAESESGGFVFGDGSESGGVYDVGSSTESGGAYNSGSSSESGGPQDTGAESMSGGIYQSEAETLSGGATNAGSSSEATQDDHNWGKYVQYYGR